MRLRSSGVIAVALTLGAVGCAEERQETSALEAYPGMRQQITSFYDANAVERDWDCDVVQMDGLTRAKVVRETPTQVVVAFQYYFDSSQAGAEAMPGCEGFGSRVATFDKGPSGVGLVRMSGEQRRQGP